MRRITGGLAVAAVSGACVALASGLGCNAIAGIQDGQLVTLDSGVDGTSQDGSIDSGGGMDGPAGDGGGMDGTTMSDSASPPVDASDAATIPTVRCTINPGSKTMVASLSGFDAGSCCGNAQQFQQPIWTIPLMNDSNGVEIVAQNAADQTDFSLYFLNFGQGGLPSPVAAGSSAMGGVRLLDVEPTPSGPPTALTTVGVSPNTQALQVVPLPNTSGGTPGAPLTITSAFLNNAFPNGAGLLPTGTNTYDWLLADNGGGVNQLVSGNSGMMQVTLLPNNPQGLHVGGPPMDLGGNLYAFVMAVGDAGTGTTVFQYPDNFSASGIQAPVASNASLSAIAEAHVSVSDSTKAQILAATIDSSGAGSVNLWAARTPASSLTSLTIGSPPFTAGTSFGLSEVPFNGGATVPYGDQAFFVGTVNGDATTMILAWVNAQGLAVSRPSVAGPLYSDGNVIRYATIAVGQAFSQYNVSLFLAWVEEVGSGSSEYDELWAAQVTCQPFAGD